MIIAEEQRADRAVRDDPRQRFQMSAGLVVNVPSRSGAGWSADRLRAEELREHAEQHVVLARNKIVVAGRVGLARHAGDRQSRQHGSSNVHLGLRASTFFARNGAVPCRDLKDPEGICPWSGSSIRRCCAAKWCGCCRVSRIRLSAEIEHRRNCRLHPAAVGELVPCQICRPRCRHRARRPRRAMVLCPTDFISDNDRTCGPSIGAFFGR